MQIDKQKIMDLLTDRGDEAKAKQADSDLPDQVDTDEHRGALEKLGVSPADLAGRFSL
ncbi:hypothetical protein [Janibacter alittae]|uniref:Uncharacterized protein n=1 Tax=Janibacter alittae TaxID=3115209 RepID=A0ABZ2MFW6_9MICO